jgi:hypothetical protein
MVIENLNVKYHGTANPIGRGHATVTYTVHNTGNVRLAASQLVSVSGLFGTKTKRISPANIQLLFPRSAQDVTVEVPDVLPTVWQKATVTVTPLLFQDQQPMPVPTDTKTKAFYAVPSTLLGSATLVVVLLLLGWYLRRRHHRRPTPPESSRHSGPDRDPDSPSDARPRPRPVNVIASQKIGS